MVDVDKALATQLANIERRTGKTISQLAAFVKGSGLERHGQIRDLLKTELGLGHGDANTLTHVVLNGVPGPAPPAAEAADALYVGAKAALRPIHDRIMEQLAAFGPFEIAPKKTYLSLRRKKQFAMVGPATNSRVDVGLNATDLEPAGRLEAMPPNSMCKFRVRLTEPSQVDAELVAWIRRCYDQSG